MSLSRRNISIEEKESNNTRAIQPPLISEYNTNKRKALLVGINYFNTRAELSGCINDVHRVAKRLKGKYQVRCLTDDQSNSRNRPTRKNIMDGLNWLTQGMQKNGKQTIFFHFSGHGSQQIDTNGDESDGLDETICPVDYQTAGMITDDELKRKFLMKVPMGNKVLSVMDCCHSGTVLDLPFYVLARNGRENSACMIKDNKSDDNQLSCDVIMISGCSDSQTSADVWSVGTSFVELADRKAGGALTSALLVAMQQNPKHNLTSLIYSIRKNLKRKGFDQIPQISASVPYDMRCTTFDLFPK